MAEMSRDTEIKGIWKRYGWFYRLLRGAVLIGVGVFVGMILYAEPQVRADYAMNLFVTALSLGATALIFEELNRKRSEDDLKRQLVDDAASTSNEMAKNAVHQLERKEWLRGENGLLKGEILGDANLQEAKLTGANLYQTILFNARLQNAHLDGANMHLARLAGAKLQRAEMFAAWLKEADLRSANLQGADLRRANLEGADLRGANLEGAKLGYAEFDGATILPDHTTKKPCLWTPETDMRRFTDPDHPDFWRSDDPMSPAYRGKSDE